MVKRINKFNLPKKHFKVNFVEISNPSFYINGFKTQKRAECF